MKTGWQSRRLGDLIQLEYGKPLPPEKRKADGRYPVYGANGVLDRTDEFYFDKPSIIVGRKGSAGEVNLTENKFWALDVTYFVTYDESKLNLHFLYNLLRNLHLPKLAQGVKPGINRNTVYSIRVSIPPLPEQHRIVAILDEVFAGIATATANAERNLNNSRELFNSGLQAIFGKRTGDPLVRIGDVAEVFDGPHATPKTVDAGPVFLGISALNDGKVNLGETRHVTPEDFKTWTRRVKPQADDIVFSYETRLGQAAIIPEGLECCLGRRMGLVRVDRTKADPRYFVHQYVSPQFRQFLKSKTVLGATVDRISVKEFPSFRIKLPPLAEQQDIADQCDELYQQNLKLDATYSNKLTALNELKQSILHQAFSGQLH